MENQAHAHSALRPEACSEVRRPTRPARHGGPVPGLMATVDHRGPRHSWARYCCCQASAAAHAPIPMPGAGRGTSEAGPEGLCHLAGSVVALTLVASGLFGGRVRDVLALRAAAGGWRAYAGAILALAGMQVVLAIVQHSIMGHDLYDGFAPLRGSRAGPRLGIGGGSGRHWRTPVRRAAVSWLLALCAGPHAASGSGAPP